LVSWFEPDKLHELYSVRKISAWNVWGQIVNYAVFWQRLYENGLIPSVCLLCSNNAYKIVSVFILYMNNVIIWTTFIFAHETCCIINCTSVIWSYVLKCLHLFLAKSNRRSKGKGFNGRETTSWASTSWSNRYISKSRHLMITPVTVCAMYGQHYLLGKSLSSVKTNICQFII